MHFAIQCGVLVLTRLELGFCESGQLHLLGVLIPDLEHWCLSLLKMFIIILLFNIFFFRTAECLMHDIYINVLIMHIYFVYCTFHAHIFFQYVMLMIW